MKVKAVLKRASALTKVGAAALSVVACQSVMAASNDYIWLHVDGKYIKTSPSANPPNQIFVAAGVAIDQESGATSRSADADAAYVKGKGCSIIKSCFHFMNIPTLMTHRLWRQSWIPSKTPTMFRYFAPSSAPILRLEARPRPSGNNLKPICSPCLSRGT